MSLQMLKISEICKKTGKSRSSIYESIKNNEFPKPYKIGIRAVAWKSTEIDEWIESREVVNF